jgi:hypothetical protein
MRIKMVRDKKVPEKLLAQAIEDTGVVEVVRASSDENSAKVLYRVTQKRVWLGVLEYALSRSDGWSAHVCQQYFMRGGRLVYGWNFILQPLTAVEAVVGLLTQAARVVPRTMSVIAGPLESFPLVGSSTRRTSKIAFDPRLPGPDKGGPSHKGAYPMGSGE